MTDTPLPRLRAADAGRDAVFDVLAAAHAAGRLDATEVDERQQTVFASRYLDELPPVVVDLPEGRAVAQEIYGQLAGGEAGASGAGASGAGSTGGHAITRRDAGTLAPRPAGGAPVPAVPAVPGSGAPSSAFVLWSGKELVPEAGTPSSRTFALMGGTTTDLSTVMGPGVEFTAHLFAMWGGHAIFVPEGVRIVDRTFNVMAGVEIEPGARGDGSNGTLVLTGGHLMAGTAVRLRGGENDHRMLE
ncbi:DUF1707 SHOCT-like domain-containing protein [Brevibacterium litoralis]|uniref:DUF1707 SHOCT-like domain-containing protein n=1 Tax=Brevibacterium litoralis TaxID=3138935 RepID=UPI0032EC5C5D